MEKTRTDLLNHLAKKHNLNSYLEIGVQVPELNFDRIICGYKVGVDPDPKARATVCKTSDEFFAHNIEMNERFPETKKLYDLVFLDGLHTAEQVQKDFENALKVLSPNGFIVLHDCNPKKEEHTLVPRPTKKGTWNGDVYKFATRLYMNNFVTVDIDNGCGVFRGTGIGAFILSRRFDYKWSHFEEHGDEDLNLITWGNFIYGEIHSITPS